MRQLQITNHELPIKDSLVAKLSYCLVAFSFFVLLTGSVFAADGYEVEESFVGDEVELYIRIDKKEVSIADVVYMQIEAAGLAKYDFDLPKIPEEFGDFEVIDFERTPDRLGKDDRVIKSAVYRLEPMSVGESELPSLQLEYVREGQEESKSVKTSPIKITVTSVLGDEAETADIADIEDVIEVKDYMPFIIAAGLALFIALLMAIALIRRKRRKEETAVKIFKSAHEIALQRLKELEEQGLVSSGRLKQFYERVSNVLRYYIEDRFSLKAPERTTEEFLAELQFDYTLSAGDKETLEQFLKHCDLVKFAKHEPDDQQVQRTVDLVRDFVERTKSNECLIEVE